jgi:hypothetical protein
MTEAVTAADHFTDEANTELAKLIGKARKVATDLEGYTAGPDIDVDRLALNGTKAQLDAWRSTRLDDARWRELVARWRDHWRQATLRRTGGVPPYLNPQGFDLYLWDTPEACDHETVRLGATHLQRDGAPIVTRVHVDLVRLAQQDTPARLLGPSAALELIGPDGIVQEAHPLRVGTRYSGAANAYRPDRPTWLPPKPEPTRPTRHIQTSRDQAAWLNNARDEGRITEHGVILGR